MKSKRVLVCFVGLLLFGISAWSQSFRGTILGTVTDSSGAVVAGATVKVRNVDTGLERTTQTTPDGSYRVPELPIGPASRRGSPAA
jgi:carboxypeptidase family protein